ncbi:Fasciclin-like arabinogalactan protein 11 [Camellia lanceoleosa]|uniref:Fasciclin-like arabinogalactan protein 11 n=1 Tax=Camellia lanceoleosa TaxID=1840588 RepID=A0ACC0HRE9_9ERIC|nr:Fasciclin-like arabinogalactan protein 11 [Camellia lanceoleosa]
MLNQLLSPPLPLLLLLITFFSLHSPTLCAQPPAATPAPSPPPPPPPGPPNITAILDKAGHFTTLIRLLKRTQMDDRIYKQLNHSDSLTIFAPTDDAFSNLKAINLNSFTDLQKIQLIQFHVVPSAIPLSEFEMVSNPLSTEAGDNTGSQFPLNVTTSENQVNVTTGIVNTTVSGTVYADNQLVVYQVDQVLLPLHFFPAASPAPSPASKAEKAVPTGPKISGANAMGEMIHHGRDAVVFVVSVFIAVFCLCV